VTTVTDRPSTDTRAGFAVDVNRIRDEARQHLNQGPVAPSNTTDVERVIAVLNQINQLGGSPDMNPATMKERAITSYSAPDDETDLQGMLRENLTGERVVTEAYTEIIRWLGEADITSRRLIEEILKDEEDHADELNDLFEG
jgi:bacterioferritin